VRFNVISNLANGVGLQRDYELLRQQLESRGHTVHGVQFNAKPLLVPPADVNIFDEVVNPLAFKAAPQQWVLPHPEWWFDQWDDYQYDMVLCKTRDCERIFWRKFGDRCRYIGWMARDLYDPEVKREEKFLHVAGKSHFKNTHAVVEGCQRARVHLTVIGEHVATPRRVTDKELKHLMNSHFCHVMPSAYEGYGHVLHEALGVGQLIITTNAPPMNEIVPSLRIPSLSTTQHHQGTLHKVSSLDVTKAVVQIMAMPCTTRKYLAKEAREAFHDDQQAFQNILNELVGRA
jgi:hypothetical protein